MQGRVLRNERRPGEITEEGRRGGYRGRARERTKKWKKEQGRLL